MYQHGKMPNLESIGAQTALITLAEQITNASSVWEIVTDELQSSCGSLDQVGIKAFVKALEFTSLNVESIIDTIEVLDFDTKLLKKKFARLVAEARSCNLPKVRNSMFHS